MPSAEEYESNARECREAAEHTLDDVERAMLLRLADQWQILADYKRRLSAPRMC
jgi:hypothetical protein